MAGPEAKGQMEQSGRIFFGCSKVMRQILVNHARAGVAQKPVTCVFVSRNTR